MKKPSYYTPALMVAEFGAFVFIMTGMFTVVGMTAYQYQSTLRQTTPVTSTQTAQLADSLNESDKTNLEPMASFANPIPDVITEGVLVVVQTTNVSSGWLHVFDVQSANKSHNKLVIQPTRNTDGRLYFYLDSAGLLPATYQIEFVASYPKSSGTNTTKSFVGPIFSKLADLVDPIQPDDLDKVIPSCTITANPTTIKKGGSFELRWTSQNVDNVTLTRPNIGTTNSVSPNGRTVITPGYTGEFVITATNKNETVRCSVVVTVNPATAGLGDPNEVSPPLSLIAPPDASGGDIIEDIIADEVDKNEPEIDEINLKVEEKQNIKIEALPQRILQNQIIIKMLTALPAREVRLFVRQANQSPRFVAMARSNDQSNWRASFDTKQIPNGNYQLYAETVTEDVAIRSQTIQVTVMNDDKVIMESREISREIKPAEPEISNLPSNREPSVTENVISGSGQNLPIAQPNFSRNVLPNQIIPTEVLAERIKIVLKENERIISEEIKRYVNTLVLESDRDTDKEVEVIQALTRQVTTNQQLRGISQYATNRLSQEIALLVDQGVTLHFLLLNRNPDELIDSSSIIFSSSTSEDALIPEALSPREFGIVRDDLFVVESVSPLVISEDEEAEDGEKTVMTEIRGRSLPNSIVTLFIYSSPIIVSIRTEADGTFAYLYEREIDDGAHEVYVALTDANGLVVAKSNPFRFIKEAEAFTVIGEDDAMIVPAAMYTSSQLTNPYVVVLGMSLLSLGLLLLFFSSTLRRREHIVAT